MIRAVDTWSDLIIFTQGTARLSDVFAPTSNPETRVSAGYEPRESHGRNTSTVVWALETAGASFI